MLIHSPRQLLAAIPHLLQFHPTDSIVCVGLDDSHVVCVARFDAADIATCDAEPILMGMRESADPAYVVVVFRDGAFDIGDLAPLVNQLDGIAQLDALHVDHTRWRSLLCTDETCCPPAGHALDDTVDPLTVDFIAAGSAPFATRDDLAAALAPKALDADEARARTEAFDALLTPWSCSRQGLTDLVTLLRQRDPMDWAQVALCCTLLDDFRWRDALLRQVLEDASLRLPVRATLMDIATRCPEAYVASTATTLAGVVWLDGNGTVARVAVDRALESNPEYSLARLLDRAFEAGIPPRVWIDSLSALTVDECMAA